MREQLGEGAKVPGHARVLVRLKNGNRLRGVVREGRFHERLDGTRFVVVGAEDPMAGLRLWYTGGPGSFAFLPYADIQEVKVQEQITALQLRQLELAQERLRQQQQQGDAEQPPEAGGQPVPPDAPGAAAEPAPAQPAETEPAKVRGDAKAETDVTAEAKEQQQKEQQRMYALLQEYPPSEGWGEARKGELERRFVVVGARPNAREQRFLDIYADWHKAAVALGALAAPGAAPPATDAPPTGRDRKQKRQQ